MAKDFPRKESEVTGLISYETKTYGPNHLLRISFGFRPAGSVA